MRETDRLDAMDVATLIDEYDAAWNAHDLDRAAAMHDAGIIFENHTAGERAEGAGGGEDFAVSEWTAHATHPDGGGDAP